MYTGPRGLGDMQDPNFIATAVATAGTVGSAGAAAVPAPAKPSITERVKAKAKQILKKN
jgi:hypothetical protein